MAKNRPFHPSSLPAGRVKNPPLSPKGLTLLGGGPLPRSSVPGSSLLEAFPSPASQRDYEVCFTTREFTSLCPVTGQPDYAEITILYVPDALCLESKSLKLYLGSFRNQGVFAEGIVNRILDDLVMAIAPRRATVTGDFAPRGGIGLCVEVNYAAPKNRRKGAAPSSGTQ